MSGLMWLSRIKSHQKLGDAQSGVPQGSVLGPLPFLIMISDIDRELDASSASSFADDIRVTMYLSKNSDTKIMQEELGKIYEWAEDNLMIFNETKFEHLEYTSHLPYEPDRWLLTLRLLAPKCSNLVSLKNIRLSSAHL